MKIYEGDIITISGIVKSISCDMITLQCKSGDEYLISPIDIHTIRPGYKHVKIADGIDLITTDKEVF